MRYGLLLAGVLLFGTLDQAKGQAFDEKVHHYIQQYRELAMAEQLRSGIPASITLAQGIHETAAGESRLARMANNHFGIKCSRYWKGMTIAHTDDRRNECFRKYASAQESYQDRSRFLTGSPRYASLFQIPVSDYRGWAKGLKAAGYATNPRYAERLIDLIDRYQLHQYTEMAAGAVPKTPVYFASAQNMLADDPRMQAMPIDSPIQNTHSSMPTRSGSRIRVEENLGHASSGPPPYGTVVYVNRLKAVYAKKGDMPLEYAILHGIRYERFLSINEIDDHPLSEDQYLYLEKKHYRGLQPNHQVKEGETMKSIARHYGVQLKSLLGFNLMKPGEEPAVGAVLNLQRPIDRKPLLRQSMEASPVLAEDSKPSPLPVGRAAADGVYIDKSVLEASSGAPKPREPIAPTTELASPSSRSSAVPSSTVPAPAATIPVEAGSGRASVPVVKIGEQVAEHDAPAADPEDFMEGVTRIPVPSVEEKTESPSETAQVSREPAVESPAPEAPSEPVDELDALKARFDRVIYGNQSPESSTISTTDSGMPGEPAIQEAAAQDAPRYHVVQKGETVFGISKKYNISMTELQRLNDLDFEKVKVGQKLRIR